MQLEIAFTNSHRFWIKLALIFIVVTLAASLLAGLGLIAFTFTEQGKPFIVLLGMGLFLVLMTLPSLGWLVGSIKRYRENPPFLAFTPTGIDIRQMVHYQPEHVKWHEIDYIEYNKRAILLYSAVKKKKKSKKSVVLKDFYRGNVCYLSNKSSLPIEQLANMLISAHKAAIAVEEDE